MSRYHDSQMTRPPIHGRSQPTPSKEHKKSSYYQQPSILYYCWRQSLLWWYPQPRGILTSLLSYCLITLISTLQLPRLDTFQDSHKNKLPARLTHKNNIHTTITSFEREWNLTAEYYTPPTRG